MGERGAAVVLQEPKDGVNGVGPNPHQVTCGGSEAAARVIPNQIIAEGGGRASAIRAGGRRVFSDDSIDKLDHAKDVEDAAAAARLRCIPGDGAVGQGRSAHIRSVGEAAAVFVCRVATNGAVGHGHGAKFVDAATVGIRRVTADGAVGQYQGATTVEDHSVVDATADLISRVAANGAVGHGQGASVADAASEGARNVVADRAIGQGYYPADVGEAAAFGASRVAADGAIGQDHGARREAVDAAAAKCPCSRVAADGAVAQG